MSAADRLDRSIAADRESRGIGPTEAEHQAQVIEHEAAARLDKITAAMIEAGQIIEAECPPGRERSLAITNLEQASMWAKAAIARNQDGR